MEDLGIAKNVLSEKNFSLVIVKTGKVIFESSTRGIRGLLTACLLTRSGVIKVFARTLSQGGKSILQKNNIIYEYGNLVPQILNLTKTDLCPFEKLLAGCSDPEQACEKLKKHIETITS
jgi:hypothetical protein